MRRLLPWLLLLAACQPLPHPFAADVPPPRSAVLSPRDGAGILVLPLAGAPPAVAEALAAALREAEVPASTQGGGNKGSYRLFVLAEPPADGGARLLLEWELRAAAGNVLGTGNGAAKDAIKDSRDANDPGLRRLAADAVPAIAKLVQGDVPGAAEVSEPLLGLRPVAGAPGDGGPALVRAMDFALRRAHVALAEKAGDKETLVLSGRVELSAPDAGRQQVKVRWVLSRADGGEVGQINQENAVPAGSLDGPWGDIAFAVANAAAPGVAALVEKAKAQGGPS
jgi:hypothetical protein